MTDVQNSLVLTRILQAPRERVWQAWTDPQMLARWWWPERFHTAYEVDLREGGRYRFRSADLPDIGVLCVAGVYLEVRPPERLAYSWEWENCDEPSTRVTVELVEHSNQTEVRIGHQGFATGEERDNHVLGWTHCLDRLEPILGTV